MDRKANETTLSQRVKTEDEKNGTTETLTLN
jgi:hypothetical protein